jgi:hypothetical protein
MPSAVRCDLTEVAFGPDHASVVDSDVGEIIVDMVSSGPMNPVPKERLLPKMQSKHGSI